MFEGQLSACQPHGLLQYGSSRLELFAAVLTLCLLGASQCLSSGCSSTFMSRRELGIAFAKLLVLGAPDQICPGQSKCLVMTCE